MLSPTCYKAGGQRIFLWTVSFIFGCSCICSLGTITESSPTQCCSAKSPESMHQSHSFCRSNIAEIFSKRNSRYNSYLFVFFVDFTLEPFLLFTEHEHKERQNVKQETAYSDSDFPNKVRNISIAALVSTIAMIAYAISTGIIQVINR